MPLSSKTIAGCALTILLCIGVLSFRSTVRDEQDREWVIHTHLVLEKLQAILIDITQAETAQRGYILTGDANYLLPYQAGLDDVRRDIKDLRRLTSDNFNQLEAIRNLDPLVAWRLAVLAEHMEVRRRSGLLAAAATVATGNNGEKLMNEIRQQMSEMSRSEEQLLNTRLRAATASTAKMKTVIVSGNVLAIAILLLAGYVIHRETARRNLAEQGLRQVNERLESRTEELSESVGELESFSYSVAHDLRAPLRHIAGYSNVVLQDYATDLAPEGQRCLVKIVAGAQEMGELVDDLLSLSKIRLQDVSLESTSLDALLSQVREEMRPECSGRNIDWQIGKLSDAKCDPGLMKQVFVNLLSNAVKYTGKRKHAVIQIGQMMEDDRRVIFVRDNGAGFEMQYVGKLFGIFQRLHHKRDFEGTGVGLAIVQRIVRKHGGRIWAKAEVDQGATFFFTLGSQETNRLHNQN
jgi:signal transduction histidine kinase